MQDVDALGRRLAIAHHEAPGIERHRLVGLVLDALLDVEHEELVERDVEGEDQALAVVPGEPRRLAGRHRGPVGGPQRVGAGHLDRRIGRRPAELGVVGMRAADRRQHRHGIALGIDRDAILGQTHIVDARALEVDRADQLGRVEGDARRAGERFAAAHDLGRLGGRRAGLHRALRAGRAGAPGWPVGACGVPFGVDAVCCWLTGGLAGGKAYCQPTMISTESTIATMKFFWSI